MSNTISTIGTLSFAVLEFDAQSVVLSLYFLQLFARVFLELPYLTRVLLSDVIYLHLEIDLLRLKFGFEIGFHCAKLHRIFALLSLQLRLQGPCLDLELDAFVLESLVERLERDHLELI